MVNSHRPPSLVFGLLLTGLLVESLFRSTFDSAASVLGSIFRVRSSINKLDLRIHLDLLALLSTCLLDPPDSSSGQFRSISIDPAVDRVPFFFNSSSSSVNRLFRSRRVCDSILPFGAIDTGFFSFDRLIGCSVRSFRRVQAVDRRGFRRLFPCAG